MWAAGIEYSIDFAFHPMAYLVPAINACGGWIYFVLFVFTLLESASLLFAWLPGQSLFFAFGSLAASAGSTLHLSLLLLSFISAVMLGGIIKYHYGSRFFARRVVHRLLPDQRMQTFLAEFMAHRQRSLTVSRFIPWVGQLAPLAAGASQMDRRDFLRWNGYGSVIWVGISCLTGFFFGHARFVQRHFLWIMLGLLLAESLVHKFVLWLFHQTKRWFERN